MPLVFQETLGPFTQEVIVPDDADCPVSGRFKIPVLLQMSIDSNRQRMASMQWQMAETRRIDGSAEDGVELHHAEVRILTSYLAEHQEGASLDLDIQFTHALLLKFIEFKHMFDSMGGGIDLFEFLGNKVLAEIVDIPFDCLEDLNDDPERNLRLSDLSGERVIAYLREHDVDPSQWIPIAFFVKLFAYFDGDAEAIEKHSPVNGFTFSPHTLAASKTLLRRLVRDLHGCDVAFLS